MARCEDKQGIKSGLSVEESGPVIPKVSLPIVL